MSAPHMTPEMLGRYEILGEVGRGAMGVVYKARDPLIDRALAIKTISLDLTSEESDAFERRFFREAKSAGRLNHSNIVTIHDVGKSDAVAFIAMEFLQGKSLREILDSGVVLPPEKIADIVAQVADGLAFAHENGIVHRDIKPPNIMVLDSGLVKITDFGIALLPTGSRTLAGVGSPRYMSPEQVVGRDLDGRADMYSLGAVLYEMLTGLPPFAGGDLNAILSQVLNETPPAPSSRNRSILPAFDHIVAKAMAKDPNDRYGTALAMAADVRRFREFEKWRPANAAAMLFRAATTHDAAASRPAMVAGTAAFLHRRKLVIYGAPAALLAALAGWAVLSKRAPPDRTLPPANEGIATAPANEGIASAPANTGAVANLAKPDLPRRESGQVKSLPPAQPASEAAPPAVKKVPPVVAKPMARLGLAVTPWGEVYVDGKKRGISPPLTELRLAPGKHRIEIRNTTFAPFSRTVELESHGYIKIKHKFQ